MERNTFAIRVSEGKTYDFRQMTGRKWHALTALLDDRSASNFSIWQIEDIVFAYYAPLSVKTAIKKKNGTAFTPCRHKPNTGFSASPARHRFRCTGTVLP